MGVDPLSWLLSNKRLREVHFLVAHPHALPHALVCTPLPLIDPVGRVALVRRAYFTAVDIGTKLKERL